MSPNLWSSALSPVIFSGTDYTALPITNSSTSFHQKCSGKCHFAIFLVLLPLFWPFLLSLLCWLLFPYLFKKVGCFPWVHLDVKLELQTHRYLKCNMFKTWSFSWLPNLSLPLFTYAPKLESCHTYEWWVLSSPLKFINSLLTCQALYQEFTSIFLFNPPNKPRGRHY